MVDARSHRTHFRCPLPDSHAHLDSPRPLPCRPHIPRRTQHSDSSTRSRGSRHPSLRHRRRGRYHSSHHERTTECRSEFHAPNLGRRNRASRIRRRDRTDPCQTSFDPLPETDTHRATTKRAHIHLRHSNSLHRQASRSQKFSQPGRLRLRSLSPLQGYFRSGFVQH